MTRERRTCDERTHRFDICRSYALSASSNEKTLSTIGRSLPSPMRTAISSSSFLLVVIMPNVYLRGTPPSILGRRRRLAKSTEARRSEPIEPSICGPATST